MLIQADAVHLPYKSKTFHACVTSPPYWGLRKYAGEQGEEPLGLEATPERHIERMVEVFREVRRVLRDDGVVWLNYGDSFNSNSGFSRTTGEWARESRVGGSGDKRAIDDMAQGQLMLMPHRLAIALQDDGWIVRNDLVWFKRNPMPESVAGWRWEKHRIKTKKSKHATEHNIKGGTEAMLRDASIHQGISEDWLPDYSDCPGCEKCEKHGGYVLRKSSWRHTRAHEYVFMLTKQMQYFCNQEAVREGLVLPNADDGTRTFGGSAKHGANIKHGERTSGRVYDKAPSGRNPRSVLGGNTPALEAFHYWLMENYNFDLNEAVELFKHQATNPGDVLDVPTAPYKGAHYATFPPKLIAPLIRASVPRRCCPECGMAWAPVVAKGQETSRGGAGKHDVAIERHEVRKHHVTYESLVKDYRPTCECESQVYIPGIVLDIFGGSGTTGMVAKQLLRRWVVMDISRPYLDEQAKVRTGSGTPANALEGLPMFGKEKDDE